jgi:oligopeptide transport system ATP-binding protein
VGESGCGKSTVGRTIIRLYDKTDGEVFYKSVPIHSLKKSELRKLRPKIQLVFQDPFSSLNPRLRVGDAIGEALLDHGLVSKEEQRDKVIETMEICGLAPYHIDRYPHEFSGGQRQRILTYLFISHDLSVVEHISTRVAVMYLGSIVEMAARDELFDHPLHPYTQALLSAVPIPDPDLKRERIILEGDIPSPAKPPKGCKFHTRCPLAKDICREQVPEYRDVGGGHFVACHLV